MIREKLIFKVPVEVSSSFYESLCSYYFNTDHYLAIPAAFNATLSGSTPTFCLRSILKRNSISSSQVIFSTRKTTSGDKGILWRFESDNKIRVWFSEDGINEWNAKTTNSFASTSTWYDINIVYDYTLTGILKASIYVNGVQQVMTLVSGTVTDGINLSANELYIGNQGADVAFLDAYINQFSIIDIAPTTAQILAAYNGGSPIISSEYYAPSNVQGEYIFDNDTYSGGVFTVIDDGVIGQDGVSFNMTPIDKDCNENPYT